MEIVGHFVFQYKLYGGDDDYTKIFKDQEKYVDTLTRYYNETSYYKRRRPPTESK